MTHIITKLKYEFMMVLNPDEMIYEISTENQFISMMLKLIMANLLKLIPLGVFLIIHAFYRSESFICQPLKAKFLFDNSVQPANGRTFEELYSKRLSYSHYFDKKAGVYKSYLAHII